MREMPQRQSAERPVQHSVVAYVRESRGTGTGTSTGTNTETTTSLNPQWRAAVTSSQSKVTQFLICFQHQRIICIKSVFAWTGTLSVCNTAGL